ncbi:MAG: Diphthamide biosynthesis protein 2 [Chaenotheca gracillima]|nr:MAG: Diphthamide biosynthesis protein 2 [Chaenotheca gracillima]
MAGPAGAPQLSTPDTRIFEAPTPNTAASTTKHFSTDELYTTYEIERTVREIRQGRWKRIALQFPDEMLVDAPRVFEALSRGLENATKPAMARQGTSPPPEKELNKDTNSAAQMALQAGIEGLGFEDPGEREEEAQVEERLFILGDTSYGACCVDEIAAEHVDADVVVHYGRSCLSPTSRLPVIYVFTEQKLDLEPVLNAFKDIFPDKNQKVILMADITHVSHVPPLLKALREEGYNSVELTEVKHDPASPIPNRSVPERVEKGEHHLHDYDLFHISEPPTSLLLTLSSRLSSIYCYPTAAPAEKISPASLKVSTSLALRRRYALLTSLSTESIFGILINTLSVKNYLHIVDRVKSQIAAAGKKSYTFVVGKVNAAKIANFSEIGGWVIIGCWESSLVESADFWKPVITPFELELTLQGDNARVWSGEWRSDFNDLLQTNNKRSNASSRKDDGEQAADAGMTESTNGEDDLDSEPESAPPEFDLRTGRYVSHSRPMRPAVEPRTSVGEGQVATSAKGSTALISKAQNGVLAINGEASPGAEYLQSRRTWKGLGSDFEIAYEEPEGVGAVIQQGRSGVARGYTVDGSDKR